MPSCNCTRSQCVKLYCPCFAQGEMCGLTCGCLKCINNETNKEEREKHVKKVLRRNPSAFNTTPIETKTGCKCKRSGCIQGYCECFRASGKCTDACLCTDCRNKEGLNEAPKLPFIVSTEFAQIQPHKTSSQVERNVDDNLPHEILNVLLSDEVMLEATRVIMESVTETSSNPVSTAQSIELPSGLTSFAAVSSTERGKVTVLRKEEHQERILLQECNNILRILTAKLKEASTEVRIVGSSVN
ncbi:hypothetical protein RCL1_008769 [Eukaryota sp. TZLM3-RCL]